MSQVLRHMGDSLYAEAIMALSGTSYVISGEAVTKREVHAHAFGEHQSADSI